MQLTISTNTSHTPGKRGGGGCGELYSVESGGLNSREVESGGLNSREVESGELN
jgi:hypothetical protein